MRGQLEGRWRPRLVAAESVPFSGFDDRLCLSRISPPANSTASATATPAIAPINPNTPVSTSTIVISGVAGCEATSMMIGASGC